MNDWEKLQGLHNIMRIQKELDRKENLTRGEFDYVVSSLLLELKDRIDHLEKIAYGSLDDI